MKFEYTVKFNGRKYFPGEDVPLEEETKPEIPEPVEVVEEVAEETPKVIIEPTKPKTKGRKKSS